MLAGFPGVAITPPVPETIDQIPDPIDVGVAARVTVVNPHVSAPVWSAPATAFVGLMLNFIRTSSDDGAHGALEMVQRS